MIARDLCRGTGLQPAGLGRRDLDHSPPLPGGRSTSGELRRAVRHHHQLKTQRYADLTDSAADGSGTWITGHGQQIRIPPRPFLHDPSTHTATSSGRLSRDEMASPSRR